MIKHLPEGLVPFEDCGFARHPEMPLAGERVTVDCRLDNMECIPLLSWETDGQAQPVIRGMQKDDRHFTFDIGVFKKPCRVSYRICAGTEQTREFIFDVISKCEAGEPLSILQDADTVTAVFTGGFAAHFRNASITCCASSAAAGDPCKEAVIDLPDGYSITVRKSVSFWQLKRSSKTIASVAGITLYRDSEGKIVKTEVRIDSPCRHILGLGERFNSVDMNGRSSDGIVTEKFMHQDKETYMPMPFFLTEQGFGWLRNSMIPAEMRFGGSITILQESEGDILTEDYILLGTPREITRQFMRITGEPVLPPDWAFGLWISANGWDCDREVDAQLAALEKYGYPASVLVLEAWSDERTFYRWNDTEHWRDPAALVRRIRDAGMHLVLWQIPIVKYEWDGSPGEALLADEKEAITNGYVVFNADGTPYRIAEKWFHNSLLADFTNPEAAAWWFGKRKHLLDMGVEGFKTDGGEFLFDKTTRLKNAMSGRAARNLYPNQYVCAYHEFMRSSHVAGVTFSRAGYLGAQTMPVHWAGDQASEWSELRAQLNAGISAGLSGVIFWGFDIGGFAGELPTAELYLRATAMACFCPVMQWHAEPRKGQFKSTYEERFINDRSPWNLAEKLNDPSVLEVALRYAKLRVELMPYILQEARVCVEQLRPMMAHLCVDNPDDPKAWETSDEYMFGRGLLVAPVTETGVSGRVVYLPEGRWHDRFTGEQYAGGRELWCECPVGRIPVFERGEEYAGS